MKSICGFALAVCLCMLWPALSSADPLRDFLGGADLSSISQSTKVLILEAQSVQPQTDLNAFDDFFLVNQAGTLLANFDRGLAVKGSKEIPRRLGLEVYSNHDIPAVGLQEGLDKVRPNFLLNGAAVGHVSIIRPLVPSQPFVYDYTVVTNTPGSGCFEYLYVLPSMTFQKGYPTYCQWTLQQFGISTRLK